MNHQNTYDGIKNIETSGDSILIGKVNAKKVGAGNGVLYAAVNANLPAQGGPNAKFAASDPQLKKLVYNMYRGLLHTKHDKANDIIESAPQEKVVNDEGVNDRVISMMRQQTELREGKMINLGPPPPPPPPPFSTGPPAPPQKPAAVAPPKAAPPMVAAAPPAAIASAMMKERKPFTYTPGGINLDEIKSPRMQRRLRRNASMEGVGSSPLAQQPPKTTGVSATIPPHGMIQVLPMPGLGMTPPVRPAAKETSAKPHPVKNFSGPSSPVKSTFGSSTAKNVGSPPPLQNTCGPPPPPPPFSISNGSSSPVSSFTAGSNSTSNISTPVSSPCKFISESNPAQQNYGMYNQIPVSNPLIPQPQGIINQMSNSTSALPQNRGINNQMLPTSPLVQQNQGIHNQMLLESPLANQQQGMNYKINELKTEVGQSETDSSSIPIPPPLPPVIKRPVIPKDSLAESLSKANIKHKNHESQYSVTNSQDDTINTNIKEEYTPKTTALPTTLTQQVVTVDSTDKELKSSCNTLQDEVNVICNEILNLSKETDDFLKDSKIFLPSSNQKNFESYRQKSLEELQESDYMTKSCKTENFKEHEKSHRTENSNDPLSYSTNSNDLKNDIKQPVAVSNTEKMKDSQLMEDYQKINMGNDKHVNMEKNNEINLQRDEQVNVEKDEIFDVEKDVEKSNIEKDFQIFSAGKNVENFSSENDIGNFNIQKELDKYNLKQENFSMENNDKFNTEKDVDNLNLEKDVEEFNVKKDVENINITKSDEKYNKKELEKSSVDNDVHNHDIKKDFPPIETQKSIENIEEESPLLDTGRTLQKIENDSQQNDMKEFLNQNDMKKDIQNTDIEIDLHKVYHEINDQKNVNDVQNHNLSPEEVTDHKIEQISQQIINDVESGIHKIRETEEKLKKDKILESQFTKQTRDNFSSNKSTTNSMKQENLSPCKSTENYMKTSSANDFDKIQFDVPVQINEEQNTDQLHNESKTNNQNDSVYAEIYNPQFIASSTKPPSSTSTISHLQKNHDSSSKQNIKTEYPEYEKENVCTRPRMVRQSSLPPMNRSKSEGPSWLRSSKQSSLDDSDEVPIPDSNLSNASSTDQIKTLLPWMRAPKKNDAPPEFLVHAQKLQERIQRQRSVKQLNRVPQPCNQNQFQQPYRNNLYSDELANNSFHEPVYDQCFDSQINDRINAYSDPQTCNQYFEPRNDAKLNTYSEPQRVHYYSPRSNDVNNTFTKPQSNNSYLGTQNSGMNNAFYDPQPNHHYEPQQTLRNNYSPMSPPLTSSHNSSPSLKNLELPPSQVPWRTRKQPQPEAQTFPCQMNNYQRNPMEKPSYQMSPQYEQNTYNSNYSNRNTSINGGIHQERIIPIRIEPTSTFNTPNFPRNQQAHMNSNGGNQFNFGKNQQMFPPSNQDLFASYEPNDRFFSSMPLNALQQMQNDINQMNYNLYNNPIPNSNGGMVPSCPPYGNNSVPTNGTQQPRSFNVSPNGFGQSQTNGKVPQGFNSEPKKYGGSSIPSRSFRILQAMTDTENGVQSRDINIKGDGNNSVMNEEKRSNVQNSFAKQVTPNVGFTSTNKQNGTLQPSSVSSVTVNGQSPRNFTSGVRYAGNERGLNGQRDSSPSWKNTSNGVQGSKAQLVQIESPSRLLNIIKQESDTENSDKECRKLYEGGNIPSRVFKQLMNDFSDDKTPSNKVYSSEIYVPQKFQQLNIQNNSSTSSNSSRDNVNDQENPDLNNEILQTASAKQSVLKELTSQFDPQTNLKKPSAAPGRVFKFLQQQYDDPTDSDNGSFTSYPRSKTVSPNTLGSSDASSGIESGHYDVEPKPYDGCRIPGRTFKLLQENMETHPSVLQARK